MKASSSPDGAHPVAVVLVVVALVAIVEVLVPGVVLRIAGKLGRTPVVVIGKTALNNE